MEDKMTFQDFEADFNNMILTERRHRPTWLILLRTLHHHWKAEHDRVLAHGQFNGKVAWRLLEHIEKSWHKYPN